MLKQPIFQSPNLSRGSSCNATLPESTAFCVSIDFDNTGNSCASAVKQLFPSVKLRSTRISLDPKKLVKLQIQTIRDNCHLHILVLFYVQSWLVGHSEVL